MDKYEYKKALRNEYEIMYHNSGRTWASDIPTPAKISIMELYKQIDFLIRAQLDEMEV